MPNYLPIEAWRCDVFSLFRRGADGSRENRKGILKEQALVWRISEIGGATEPVIRSRHLDLRDDTEGLPFPIVNPLLIKTNSPHTASPFNTAYFFQGPVMSTWKALVVIHNDPERSYHSQFSSPQPTCTSASSVPDTLPACPVAVSRFRRSILLPQIRTLSDLSYGLEAYWDLVPKVWIRPLAQAGLLIYFMTFLLPRLSTLL